MPQKNKKYILAGGGSGGSVSPLLAVAEVFGKKMPELEAVFIGTGKPEDRMARKAGIKFLYIVTGKFQRYLTFHNILAPLWVLIGFLQSIVIIKKIQPAFIFGTGSYVQVPVMWAGWLMRIPIFIHQQDYVPSLANRLCTLLATKITVTFPKSTQDFAEGWTLKHGGYENRVIVTGNPVRKLKLSSREHALKKPGLDPKFPTLLFTGGGTGALSLNELVWKSLPGLLKIANVIHLTGTAKSSDIKAKRYLQIDFSDDMALLYSAVDVVVCRAGLSTLSELAEVQKPALVVPLPGTHQELNAHYASEHGAILAVEQSTLTEESLIMLLRNLFFEHKLQKDLAKNLQLLLPKDADIAIMEIIRHNIALKSPKPASRKH